MSPIANPLRGQTVLNLRAAEDAAALSDPLRELGATVIEHPILRFAPPSSWEPFDTKARHLAEGCWVAFTSGTAVRKSIDRLEALGIPLDALKSAKIAAIGHGTAKALTTAGLTPTLVPAEDFQAEGLRDALLSKLGPGEDIWLPRAEVGRETLIEDLTAAGHPVLVTPVYRTITPSERLDSIAEMLSQGRIDWIVFTSSSMVSRLLQQLPAVARANLSTARIACLGKITARTAEEAGLNVEVVPKRQDLAGLIEGIVEASASKPKSGHG